MHNFVDNHQASIRSFVDYTRQIVPTICHYEVILGLLGLYLLSCDSHIGRLKVRSVARIFFVQFVQYVYDLIQTLR